MDKNKGNNLFLKPDQHLPSALKMVTDCISSQKFEKQAINDFLQTADYYLIAYAHKDHYTIVTHEGRSDSTKKIKIPNICVKLDIEFMNPFEMLFKEKARFILERKSR